MFEKYLKQIGLEELIPTISKVKLNTIVEKVFATEYEILSEEEVKKLFIYDVPKMSADGSCSIISEKADKPYNLAKTLGLTSDFSRLKGWVETERIWKLNKIVHKIYQLSGVEWFGIYRKVKNLESKTVLVKEAYEGIFSRAEFPLTKKFATKSNNSTVGLTGKAIVIQDVATHNGVYYKCDGEVNSEFCAPILDKKGKVIGIIDAEAFATNHYTPERLLQIAKVSFDLGQRGFGL